MRSVDFGVLRRWNEACKPRRVGTVVDSWWQLPSEYLPYLSMLSFGCAEPMWMCFVFSIATNYTVSPK